ncbi:TlpA disulfide reductase family protein [Terrabacter terrae]|uniref:TlpA disulfide reductase family protein n=1 Tax=Terrabacter terrae TaxID=318434 RepID=A0ABN2U1N3_9MICO
MTTVTSPMRFTCTRWVAVSLAIAVLTSACSAGPNTVSAQAAAGDRKGYISGDGTIETVPPSRREDPITLTGTTLEGGSWSTKGKEGKVIVVNVWGSWCPPCITEAPELQRAWEHVRSRKLPVEFIGLDKQESPETALAFQHEKKITYPSLAYDGGVPILSLRGKATATPTTLVLDRHGRLAARVSGPLTTSTLTGLIDDVIAQ